jgi:sulfur relay (sulfurtransferase) DsrC/TusE family protein
MVGAQFYTFWKIAPPIKNIIKTSKNILQTNIMVGAQFYTFWKIAPPIKNI